MNNADKSSIFAGLKKKLLKATLDLGELWEVAAHQQPLNAGESRGHAEKQATS